MAGEEVMKLVGRWLQLPAPGETGEMTGEAAGKLRDRMLDLARADGGSFVGAVLSDPREVESLVKLRGDHPACFSGLLEKLTELPGLNRAAATRLEKGIVQESKRRRNQPVERPKYLMDDGATYFCGGEDEPPTLLANFTAKIAREIIKDDGVEQQRFYDVELDVSGEKLKCSCKATDFGSMSWIR